jgi:prepilin-type N-terminal cleavage/methylation domain-containing protein
MKKRGYTLIEIMVSIFILTILFSAGMAQSKFGNNLLYGVEKTDYIYEIQNLISYGKAMCREKNKYGEIIIDSEKNQMRFIDAWDNVEKIIKLPKEVIIIPKDKIILITSEGKIVKGNTITLVDKYKVKQDITISVGGDLISIKDGDFL